MAIEKFILTKIWGEASANVESMTPQKTSEAIQFQSKASSAQVNGALQQIYKAVMYQQQIGGYWYSDIKYPQGALVCCRVKICEWLPYCQLRWYVALKENENVQPTDGAVANIENTNFAMITKINDNEKDTTETWLELDAPPVWHQTTSDEYEAIKAASNNQIQERNIYFLLG